MIIFIFIFFSINLVNCTFQCCYYHHSIEKTLYGGVCVPSGYQCPGDIEYWGEGPIQVDVGVDCTCNGPNVSTADHPKDAKIVSAWKAPTTIIADQHQEINWDDDGYGPIQCCFYSKPMYSNTKPIFTSALNPDQYASCPGTQYGVPLEGQWYVLSMYNQCFFELFSTN